MARPSHYDEFGQAHKFLPFVPSLNLIERVRSDQKEQMIARPQAFGESSHGIHCVTSFGGRFYPRNLEARVSLAGDLHHAQPVFERRQGSGIFVWRIASRNEYNPVKVERG
jgi:hypothetical protein